MKIQIGNTILANGERFVVTAEPYVPEDLEDSAIDETYTIGEYIIPVNDGGAIYESEVVDICR